MMNIQNKLIPFAAIAFAAIITLAGCKSTSQQASNNPSNPQASPSQQSAGGQPGGAGGPSGPGSAPQGPPPPAAVDLPAGTRIRVRLDEDLGSKISQPGDSFTATVDDDVIVSGQTVIARGARADGTVIDAKPLGRFKGGAVLAIKLDRVHTNWGSYPVETRSIDRAEKGKGKRTAGFIGGGAGLGAIIGGIAGGGKGAAIGALAGGGAGTAGTAFTGNHQIVLPAETLLTFRLDEPVHVTEQQ